MADEPAARPSNPSVILAPLDIETTIKIITRLYISHEKLFKNEGNNHSYLNSLFFTNGIVVIKSLVSICSTPLEILYWVIGSKKFLTTIESLLIII